MEGSKRPELSDYAHRIIRFKAGQFAGKYGFTRDDYEDLCQEMVLDLLVRLPKYDPGKASLNTFVARIVDRKVANLIRFQRQEKRDHRREAFSLNDTIEDRDGHLIPREETVSQDAIDLLAGKSGSTASERSDVRLDVSLALSRLPPDLQRLAKLLMTHSITDVARELRLPRGTLYGRSLANLREILRQGKLKGYL